MPGRPILSHFLQLLTPAPVYLWSSSPPRTHFHPFHTSQGPTMSGNTYLKKLATLYPTQCTKSMFSWLSPSFMARRSLSSSSWYACAVLIAWGLMWSGIFESGFSEVSFNFFLNCLWLIQSWALAVFEKAAASPTAFLSVMSFNASGKERWDVTSRWVATRWLDMGGIVTSGPRGIWGLRNLRCIARRPPVCPMQARYTWYVLVLNTLGKCLSLKWVLILFTGLEN